LGEELIDCIKNTSFKLTEKFNAGGFNLVVNTNKCAEQIVNHFHVHILPRREDDGLSLSLKK